MPNLKCGGSLRVCSLALFSLFLFLPDLARAEQPVHTLKELQAVIRAGDSVVLDEVDDTSVLGKVESISNSSLRLRIHGFSREFFEPQIREVTKVGNASVKGVMIGGGIGVVLGGLFGWAISDAFCDGCGNAQGQGAAYMGVLFGSLGAGIGYSTGSHRQNFKTVFAMSQITEKRFRVSPMLSRQTRGVALAFRF